MYSPRISLDMMTVKIGAELFTVSANDTATFFRLTKPRTTVVNLTEDDGHLETPHLYVHYLYICSFHWVAQEKSVRGGTHLMSPTNNMIIMKLGGYSVLDLCWYRQQGMNIFRQPMTVVDIIWTAPWGQSKAREEEFILLALFFVYLNKNMSNNAHVQWQGRIELCTRKWEKSVGFHSVPPVWSKNVKYVVWKVLLWRKTNSVTIVMWHRENLFFLHYSVLYLAGRYGSRIVFCVLYRLHTE